MTPKEDNIFVVNLPVENCCGNIIIQTTWNEHDIRFQIVDLCKTEANEWIGGLQIEDLKATASDLDKSFEEFLTETKQALCTIGGIHNFSYAIEDDKFIWRKKEKFKIIYGEVNLTQTENLKDHLIMDSINIINRLRNDYQNLQIQFQKQNVEFETYVESYRNCLNEKNNLEKNLLNKFCTLLNSKKDKIAELQQLLVEKHSILPSERSNGDCRVEGNSFSSDKDDILTQRSNTGSSTGLTLPKRRKLIEEAETSSRSQMEDSISRMMSNSKPSCSHTIVENIVEDESNEDNIFDKM